MTIIGIERALVFEMSQGVDYICVLSSLGGLTDDFEKFRHHDVSGPSLEISAVALPPKPLSIFRIALYVSHRSE
jgi:hypothetical protein